MNEFCAAVDYKDLPLSSQEQTDLEYIASIEARQYHVWLRARFAMSSPDITSGSARECDSRIGSSLKIVSTCTALVLLSFVVNLTSLVHSLITHTHTQTHSHSLKSLLTGLHSL